MAKRVNSEKGLQEKVHPNCIYSLDDPKLGQLAKAMLVRLAHLAQDLDEIFYSNERLASDLNVSIRSIINALHELEDRGYISRKQKHAVGTKVTEVNHRKIILRLLESPSSNRHLAWLKAYYKTPKKKDGKYLT